MPNANDRQVGGDHYRKHGAELQHWDLVNMFGWDYFQGQIIKYLMRWRDKNGVQDLEKAAHYLQKYIECEQSDEARTVKGLANNPNKWMPRIDAVYGPNAAPDYPTLEDCKKKFSNFAPQYAEPGHVYPTGWIGYTHEGADGNGFHFRCKKCLERFYTVPDGNPHLVHDHVCKGARSEEPDASYTGQGADPLPPTEGHTA